MALSVALIRRAAIVGGATLAAALVLAIPAAAAAGEGKVEPSTVDPVIDVSPELSVAVNAKLGRPLDAPLCKLGTPRLVLAADTSVLLCLTPEVKVSAGSALDLAVLVR